MRALSSSDLLWIREHGESRAAPDRPLIMLAAVGYRPTWAALSALTLGQRNRALIELRQTTIGPHASCLVRCPACQVELDVQVDTQVLLDENPQAGPLLETIELSHHRSRVRFAVPRCADVARALNASEPHKALMAICILAAESAGAPIPVGEIGGDLLVRIGEQMALADPLSRIEITLTCGDCEHRWHSNFDISTFLWQEIVYRSHRLVDQIDTLARAYGWPEHEILALSPTRRRWYLERVV